MAAERHPTADYMQSIQAKLDAVRAVRAANNANAQPSNQYSSTPGSNMYSGTHGSNLFSGTHGSNKYSSKLGGNQYSSSFAQPQNNQYSSYSSQP